MDDELVIFQSNDGQDFELEYKVAKLSATAVQLIEDAGTDNPIPFDEVSGKIMEKVVLYCKWKTEHPEESKELTSWEKDFCESLDQTTLFELILAANYMAVSELLDMTCVFVADMIKGKSPEEIRTTFNIKKDFTEDEEKQVEEEMSWVAEATNTEATNTEATEATEAENVE